MAINAESGGGGGEARLQLGVDGGGGGVGMAIGKSLLRRLRRLLRLGRVMANFAFARDFSVRWVVELDRAHGSVLQQDWTHGGFLCKPAANQHEDDKKSKQP